LRHELITLFTLSPPWLWWLDMAGFVAAILALLWERRPIALTFLVVAAMTFLEAAGN
jgi:hypothetical protein